MWMHRHCQCALTTVVCARLRTSRRSAQSFSFLPLEALRCLCSHGRQHANAGGRASTWLLTCRRLLITLYRLDPLTCYPGNCGVSTLLVSCRDCWRHALWGASQATRGFCSSFFVIELVIRTSHSFEWERAARVLF